MFVNKFVYFPKSNIFVTKQVSYKYINTELKTNRYAKRKFKENA